MTVKRENQSSSNQPPGDALVRIRLPEYDEVEVYLVRKADGTLVARTAAELAKEKPASKSKGKG